MRRIELGAVRGYWQWETCEPPPQPYLRPRRRGFWQWRPVSCWPARPVGVELLSARCLIPGVPPRLLPAVVEDVEILRRIPTQVLGAPEPLVSASASAVRSFALLPLCRDDLGFPCLGMVPEPSIEDTCPGFWYNAAPVADGVQPPGTYYRIGSEFYLLTATVSDLWMWLPLPPRQPADQMALVAYTVKDNGHSQAAGLQQCTPAPPTPNIT